MSASFLDRLLARASGQLGTARPLLPGRFETSIAAPAADSTLTELTEVTSESASAPDSSRERARAPRSKNTETRPERPPAAIPVRPLPQNPSQGLRPQLPAPAPAALGVEKPKAELPPRPRLDPEGPPRRPVAPGAVSPSAVPLVAARTGPASSPPVAKNESVFVTAPPPAVTRQRTQRPELAPEARPKMQEPPMVAKMPLAGPTRTVEIHIGRIEVVAPKPTVAAKPTSPREAGRPAALSLDDYLRRRRGG